MRGLEERIRHLEKDLAATSRGPTPPVNEEHIFDDAGVETGLVREDVSMLSQMESDCHFNASDIDWTVLGAVSGDSPLCPDPRPRTQDSLDSELKNLSLEATAERHLGSSSGLSFAKLTQTVLRRLSPDKADFVFGSAESDDTHQHALDPSSNLFNYPTLLNFGNSMSCNPILFGDFLLPDIAGSGDDLSHLFIPSDDSKVDRLVDFYFAHSHTLYPIVQRTDFIETLRVVRENPQASSAQSPLSLFRIWMVLAIGSTAYCSVSLAEESESTMYYNKALVYFEASLAYGDMVCLRCSLKKL